MSNETPSSPPEHDDHHEPMPEGEEQAPPGAGLMSVVRWGLVALLALLAVVSWFAYGRGSPAPKATVAPPAAVDGDHAHEEQAAATRYVCPMHPQVVQDHPGECPICHMALVPVSVGGSRGASDVHGVVPVELSEQRIQLMGMRTAKAWSQQVSTSVRTVGYVVANEARVSRVHARTSGWVEKLDANETGQRVKRGQVLARIYSPDLLAAQRELVAITTRGGLEGSGLARELADDVKRKLSLYGMSPGDIEQVERSGKATRTVNLRAPSEGFVTNKGAFDGLYFQPGTTLFEVSDLSTVWVIAEIYEQDLASVELGQRAVVELNAYPGKTFRGSVDFIYPAIDPSTRTMRVRIAVPNPDLKLLPGMYAQATLWTEGEEGIVVPVEATIDTGDQQYVFIAKGDGLFEPRRVTFGRRTGGGGVEIVEGLDEGETVVTTANFLLDSESRLRAALERPAASPHDAH